MKLSRLYCNRPDLFGPLPFNPGVNVVLGEIRLPKNRERDTHNLGKSTIARVIDFCLLRKRTKEFFLFKHAELFQDFIFFLEIETLAGDYVTVRRSVVNHSRIAFKRHDAPRQDFTHLPDAQWTHADIPWERARELLDGILDLRAVKPWSYRMPVSYALRIQRDFGDVFQLDKFRGSHAEWKPYIAHVLGFDARLVTENYELSQRLEAMESAIKTIRGELAGVEASLDTLEGLLTLKTQEESVLTERTDRFDFQLADANVNRALVDELDREIGALNQQRYYLTASREKITASLGEQAILFDPDSAARLFEEAGQVFPGALKKEFNDLIRFNRAITEERRGYLRQELKELELDARRIEERLTELNERRQEALAFLKDTDSIHKYRRLTDRLATLRAEIERLRQQRDAFLRLREREKERSELETRRVRVQQAMEDDIETQARTERGRYQRIRLYVNEVARAVVDKSALVSSRLNREGNIEFSADYLGADNKPTSEDLGHSYRRLLCVAFDLAVARAMLDAPFIRFVYHDGLLEGLDNRVKRRLIEVVRRYAGFGVQQIITVLDSDLPLTDEGERFVLADDEVILTLHDEGDRGRLFRMPEW